MPSVARHGAVAIGALLLASCVTTKPVGERLTDRTVTFPTYAVPAPQGEDWGATREEGKERISFLKKTTGDIGPFEKVLLGMSSITVFKVPVTEIGAAMPEEELARNYLDGEHQDMLVRGVLRNLYDLRDLTKGVETIGGRTLYTMRYTTESKDHKSEAALFLYVPPDYATRRAFYGFHIEEAWTESGKSPGLGSIEPMIAGFTLLR